ncbi:MAG: transglycosylase SLT domain-containing protein [Myxococcales bacterium]|nr:transglycosylase SLT domain-containing protein [Myxococcales bacterium]MCB9644138.1 transglycosylase SLT domain-containing protein [Myxococcales bacterium]
MGTSILFLWLLQWVGTEPLEPAAYKAAREGRLDQAAWYAELASGRRKGRRESRARWQEEQTRLAYFAGHLAFRRHRPLEASKWFGRSLRDNNLYKDYSFWYLAKAQTKAGLHAQAAATYQAMLKEYRRVKVKRKVRNALLISLRKAKDWKAYTELVRSLLPYPGPYGGRRRMMWWLADGYHKLGDIKESAKYMRQYALDYPHRSETKKAEQLLTAWGKAGKLPAHQWNETEQSFRLYRLARFRPKRALPLILRSLKKLQKAPKPDVMQIEYMKKWHAHALMRDRQHKKAIPILEDLAKRTYNVSLRREAYKLLGRAYTEIGAFERGVEQLHAFAEREPESETAKEAAYRSIWMAMRLQRYAQARQFIEEYMQIYPEEKKFLPALQWFRLWTLFREGDYKKAITEFKKWGRKNRGGVAGRQVNYWLGRSYERLGRWDMAKGYYSRVAKVAPLTYYGVLSQHRLYVLEDQIQQHHESYVCAFKTPPLAKRRPLLTKREAARRAHRKPQGAMLDRKQVGYTTSLNTNNDNADQNTLFRNLARMAQEQLPAEAKFPSIPGFCRGATSRSCKAFRRAELFDRLGLDADAVTELSQARWAIQRSKPRILEAIRWFYSKKAYHPGVVLSFYLQRKIHKAPRLTPEQSFKIRYPLAYHEALLEESRRSGVPFAFAWAITREESLFRIRIRSWADAFGLMQIIPDTAYKIANRIKLDDFRLRDLYHPSTNIKMGCWYLGQLLEKFQSHVMLAAAAYNAGPHRVAVWLKDHHNVSVDEFVEEIPFQETRNYVKRVFRTFVVYNYLYGQTLTTPPTTVAVRVGQNIDF